MQLQTDQLDKIAEICRRYGVHRLQLFGSAAIGLERPDSDVDLLVEFEPYRTPSGFDLVDMQEELEHIFGGRKVDLAFPSILDNPYRRRVIEPQLRSLY
jgi:predicted nucleotidyltransferase